MSAATRDSGSQTAVTKPGRPSRDERVALGKAVRQRVPLAAHAAFVAEGRSDPVALLESQAASRVPELVPIRYGRMLASDFAFYRGGALIMAADLSRTPNSGLHVQLCGDAHVSNFGVYATPERRMMFDVNDFDETHPGPFEWDIKRLAASLAVAGRDNGLPRKKRRKLVLAACRAYREGIRTLADRGNLAVWYAHLDMSDALGPNGLHLDAKSQARTSKALAKARTHDSLQALGKLTTVVDGRARIVNQPLVVPVEDLFEDMQADAIYAELRGLIASYSRTLQSNRRHLLAEFELVQVARKVVGVGSVGTRAWILLFEGIDGGDPLFLQAKEAQASVLSGFVKGRRYQHQGARVVSGQLLMQASSDIFLGWQRVEGLDGIKRDFYLRQLRDGKGSAVIEEMRPRGLAIYAGMCGEALARAHARSGDRVAIAAYLGASDRFDQAVADFAETYAAQNELDHSALEVAAKSGRIAAQTGL